MAKARLRPRSIDEARAKGFNVLLAGGVNLVREPRGGRNFEYFGEDPLLAGTLGHGLSYTQYAYSDLVVSGGSNVQATFRITNTGAHRGTETAQVYVRVDGVRRLVGWARVELAPDENKVVTVTADPRLLANFDVQAQAWRIAPGSYSVEVSTAVNEPRLTADAVLLPVSIRP